MKHQLHPAEVNEISIWISRFQRISRIIHLLHNILPLLNSSQQVTCAQPTYIYEINLLYQVAFHLGSLLHLVATEQSTTLTKIQLTKYFWLTKGPVNMSLANRHNEQVNKQLVTCQMTINPGLHIVLLCVSHTLARCFHVVVLMLDFGLWMRKYRSTARHTR